MGSARGIATSEIAQEFAHSFGNVVGVAPSSNMRGSTRRAPSEAEAEQASLWSRHRRDVWAIVLAVVGLFLALSLFGALGPLGHGLNLALGAMFGVARWFLPLGCLALAGAIMWGGLRVDGWRVGLGLGIGTLALCGFGHLAGGRPGYGASTSDLAGAGGWVGIVVGGGLARVAGTAGAAVVLAAMLLLSFVFLTGVGLRRIASSLATSGRFLWRQIGEWWRRDQGPGPVAVEPVSPEATELVDVTDDAEHREDAREVSEPETAAPEVVEPARAPRAPVPTMPQSRHWSLPSSELLMHVKEQKLDRAAVDDAGDELVDALAAHGVATTLVGYTVGPTVTRFELELGAGVKVSSLTSLHRDIAYAMASPDVRILAPIPGRSAIGVEVPNRHRTLVALGDILDSEEASAAPHPLDVPLGRDISGRAVVANLADMPHVLISGATGAGKSSCINSLITSLIMRTTPDEVRLILIDPKRVELGQYNGLPHLLSPVVVDPKQASATLAWAVKEMERRYDILAEHHVRDITGYQALLAEGAWEREPTSREQVSEVMERTAHLDTDLGEPEAPESLPYVVIVVDELNDLMMVAAREVEDSVVRIAQMARAVGIHLVLATQRPSVDVITGVIKANIPSRMAFAVSSLADSRVILDQSGAERLIGKGDVLLLTASSNVARRLQSPWVSEGEVRKVVEHWRAQGGVRETVVALDEPVGSSLGVYGSDDDDDAILAKAREIVISTQLGSTSMLQRKLRVGFARAGRIMDMLEQQGVVGPSEGSKARRVLVSPEQWEQRQSS
jgi:S-DNA-T family DNA segregation ATPase FtsK/SpoIIIE